MTSFFKLSWWGFDVFFEKPHFYHQFFILFTKTTSILALFFLTSMRCFWTWACRVAKKTTFMVRIWCLFFKTSILPSVFHIFAHRGLPGTPGATPHATRFRPFRRFGQHCGFFMFFFRPGVFFSCFFHPGMLFFMFVSPRGVFFMLFFARDVFHYFYSNHIIKSY